MCRNLVMMQLRLNAPIISNEVRYPEDSSNNGKHQTSPTNLVEGWIDLPVRFTGKHAMWCGAGPGLSGIASRATTHGRFVNQPTPNVWVVIMQLLGKDSQIPVERRRHPGEKLRRNLKESNTFVHACVCSYTPIMHVCLILSRHARPRLHNGDGVITLQHVIMRWQAVSRHNVELLWW